MQTSAHVLIPSPFSGRARACPVLDTGVGVKSKVAPNNCAYNHYSTPIPTFPLTWGRSFNSAVLIPSPFRGRARLRVSVGVKSKVEPKNCSLNHHLTPIPTFPLTWGRSFNSAVLIPSPFRGRAGLRVSVGVESKVAPKNCSLNHHLTPIPTFPLASGRSFNYRALLIPSPFRGRARVGVKSNLTFTASTLAPFPFTWGRSFNHAK